MKTRLLSTVVAVLLASACASAQSTQKIVANVPFGFHVGSMTLPAGEYVVAAVAPNVLRVSALHSSKSALVSTIPTQSTRYNEEPKLIFNRYGDTYFLSRICPSGPFGADVLKGRQEKETALIAARHTSEVILARRSK